MIIYCDGGLYFPPKNTARKDRTVTVTYGVLFHCGYDEPIETSGKYELSLKYQSIYEHIAFLESFKLLKDNNIDYKKVSFFTDSEDIGYAQTYLHKDNYATTRCEKFLNELGMALHVLSMEHYKEEVIDCLLNSTFHKIKSHTKNFTVDNMRVDYLSKLAFNEKKPLSYQNFLECSFFKYKTVDSVVSFNLPFMPKEPGTSIKI